MQRRVDRQRAGRTRTAAPGEPPARRRRRDPAAGHGFVREGDPGNVYRCIEAEKVEQRNVKRACELLQVSGAAYYAHRSNGAWQREQDETDLTEAIMSVHEDSKGRYGAPRIQAELRRAGRRHGTKRIARLMRPARIRPRNPETVEQDHPRRSGGRDPR